MLSIQLIIAIALFCLVLAQIIVKVSRKAQNARIKRKTEKIFTNKSVKDHPSIPVVIVTGFLGSGKTTLIKHLLFSSKEKIIVVENEFGNVSIDDKLIESQAAGVVVLKNGCICCTSKGKGHETERVLNRLLELQANSEMDFSYIVIETSGLADPTPLLRIFLQNETREQGFFLKSIVTVVDSHNILHTLKLKNGFLFNRNDDASKQIAFADIIVKNKVDMVDEHKMGELEDIIKQLNVSATQFSCINGELDLLSKLNTDYSFNTSQCEIEDRCNHSSDVNSVSVTISNPIDLEKFQVWLKTWLLEDDRWQSVFRLKGIFEIVEVPDSQKSGVDKRLVESNSPLLFAMQGVYLDVCGTFHSPEELDNVSSIVFIGRNLPKEEIVLRVKACEVL